MWCAFKSTLEYNGPREDNFYMARHKSHARKYGQLNMGRTNEKYIVLKGSGHGKI